MLNVILLVQTPADVAAIDPSIPVLKSLPINALWVIHSPAVVVDVQAAHAELDKQIAERVQAMREASAREDYTGAEGHRVARDGLVLQKAKIATDGVKNAPPEQRAAMAQKIFGAFYDALKAPQIANVGIDEHPQHFETKDWNEMLNGMKGRWPSFMPHGNYLVTWPGQVSELLPSVDTKPLQAPVAASINAEWKNPGPTPAPQAKQGYTQSPRFKQLCGMGIDALYPIAREAGIVNPSGTKLKIVHAIMKAELAKEAKAA